MSSTDEPPEAPPTSDSSLEMSSTDGPSRAPPTSDSSLDTILTAAIVAREQTSDSSSDISESTRQGLADDFIDSSEGESVGQPPPGPGPPGPPGPGLVPGQARIWGSTEDLRLVRGGAVPPAQERGAATPPAAATAGTAARARRPGDAPATAPPLHSGFTLPPQNRSSDDTVAALIQQLRLRQREHQEQMAEMNRYLREVLNRPNVEGAGPTYPRASEVGHPGYGPPLPPLPPTPGQASRL